MQLHQRPAEGAGSSKRLGCEQRRVSFHRGAPPGSGEGGAARRAAAVPSGGGSAAGGPAGCNPGPLPCWSAPAIFHSVWEPDLAAHTSVAHQQWLGPRIGTSAT